MADELNEHDFQILDDYLARLQTGDAVDRESFLREHPQLASALNCLEALEKLAPNAEKGSGPICQGPQNGDRSNLFREPSGLFRQIEPVPFLPSNLPRPFGRYQLLSEIGRGGMGVVYMARQEELDRLVAVKMILSSNLASPDQVRRFQVEARAAAKLRHSHIVPIHEVGQCNGQDYFTMEYIDGQSLAERIQEKKGTGPICRNEDGDRSDLPKRPRGFSEQIGPVPFASNKLDLSPFSTAVYIVSAIARAVDYLHRQGIVHRDLKPSNILLDAQGEPFLTDFGLAKLFTSEAQQTATGVIIGTPAYMAPEQASGHGHEIGPAADVYSLGAILYELLTGQPPFLEENPLDTLLNVLSVDPTLPRRLNPKIPRELELVCLTCLNKSPAERYTSAEALADDLDRFARGEPIKVRAPHLGQRFLSWTRRQPALASRLGGLGLFYGIECLNYQANGAEWWDFHRDVSVVAAFWVLSSIICQYFLDSRRWSFAAPFVWGTLDSIFLFIVLWLGSGAVSPLIVGYMLLIGASGLWFRVRFVFYVLVIPLLSYGVLLLNLHYYRPELQADRFGKIDAQMFFVVSLLLLATIVAYLVQRVRTLSNFYGQKNRD
jgi:eukaryotic-like serine/threonine-protein kinase